MKSAVPKDANPARAGGVRKPGVSSVAPTAEGRHEPSPEPKEVRHVYRVGDLKISVKNSVRGPKSRCAGRVKDLLRRRAEHPIPPHSDPTEIEPPIRKPPLHRERVVRPDFLPPSRGLSPGRERFEPEADVEDFDVD
jgi:hypothetical protein